MMNDKILSKLKMAFKDFKFYASDHHYECKGQRIGMSVTRLIDEYVNEFDSQAVAEKVAIRDNKSVKQVLNEWKQKNEFSKAKGHTCHEFAQCLWSHELWNREIYDNSLEFKMAVDAINEQAYYFHEDYQDKLIHLADEFVIGAEEYDIASAIDHLFINARTGGLVLVDYKTNSDIYKNEEHAKNMKIPLHKLKDTKLNHYAIQLSIYKYLVERYTDIEVSEMFIVWFSECNENYKIIEVPYLKNEVEEILENRRVKNMNGMGVLLMGASGSGKSTSLRNLPADQTAIINIANKPMPFRNINNIKVVSLEDFKTKDEREKGTELTFEEFYKRIINTIKNTDKKIIVIDDSSYMMTFENFEKATNKGYDKFTNMGKNYYDLLKSAISCDNEKIVYVFTHEEIDDINQMFRPKTIGKMLSNQLVIEGLFTIVLRSMYKNGEYIFQTQNDGTSVCKSPMDMFENKEIPNDLYEVDKIIRKFYGFKSLEKEEQ